MPIKGTLVQSWMKNYFLITILRVIIISYLKKLYHYTARDSLVTISKPSIRPHLDYADVIFDKSSSATFSNRIECNAALEITGTVRGTSKEKPYQELGFEAMKKRRWSIIKHQLFFTVYFPHQITLQFIYLLLNSLFQFDNTHLVYKYNKPNRLN